MKKTVLFMAFTILSICTVFAQDSTHTGTKQVHKKAMYKTLHSNSPVSTDSVNAGKITTNPNGKMGSKRKTHTSATGSSPADSAR